MVARVAARVSRSMRAPARALARTAALAAVLVRSELADAGSVLPRAALSERRGQEGSDAPRGRSCSSLARVLCGLEAASGAGGRGRSRSEVERVRRGDEGGGDPLWRKGVLQGRAMGDWRVLELDLVGAGPRVRVVVVVLSSRELLLLSLLLLTAARSHFCAQSDCSARHMLPRALSSSAHLAHPDPAPSRTHPPPDSPARRHGSTALRADHGLRPSQGRAPASTVLVCPAAGPARRALVAVRARLADAHGAPAASQNQLGCVARLSDVEHATTSVEIQSPSSSTPHGAGSLSCARP